ncbi:uncharacterized protein Nmag_3309 [Natrialba magadii ATCC 43099]|uniref:Uncharacterized protein n=1 Tax=Natrialba magadii (strain ATCC 43099 / DSM 3394 / CCM 3739 / CIP 104546 / IAM 13178 / JCM 8861 / NBRC 102185 / NCIMB 2190 / MS3) TaxID=547559 RepID=D3SSL4_NATMM|nr:hypothetical protein [Natrialba magadii]ADD06859.1 uncharacterized protein Nmag_3309 [Natrialba magadii ATCC 43099]ELY28213.1 hypothetical protein C500_13686 [Natrialba magadii ATCC 43099]
MAAVGNRYVAVGIESENRRLPSAISIADSGDLEWRWQHPADERGTTWAVTALGADVVLVGSLRVDNQDGETPWIARVDANGETVWETFLWDEADDARLTTVTRGPDETVFVAGTSEGGEIGSFAVDDHDGDVQWRRTTDETVSELEDVEALGDGYALVGSRETDDGTAAWVGVLAQDGETVWTTTLTEERRTTGTSICETADGGLLVGGETRNDASRAWLAKLGGDAEVEDRWEMPSPSLPGWVTPFVAGIGIGGGVAGVLARRRSGATASATAGASDQTDDPSNDANPKSSP